MRLGVKINVALDIWVECDGKKNITAIKETAWRIVELQEKISARKLVDSIEEQQILEELIEESKPVLLQSQIGFHSLLYTPFRYPPLKYGSRFGKRTEPSLWYGSLNIEIVMAEKAFYQLAFINASTANFGMTSSPMATFSVLLNMINGVKLNEAPFIKFKNKISSPSDYKNSQLLGTRMRESNVDGFTFYSARDVKTGINVGIFKIHAFANKNPDSKSFETWQCNTTKINVEFIQTGSLKDRIFTFSIQDFQVNGRLPFPAIT